MVGVASAATPCGPYNYLGSFKPFGADSRDMGLFQDSESLLKYFNPNSKFLCHS